MPLLTERPVGASSEDVRCGRPIAGAVRRATPLIRAGWVAPDSVSGSAPSWAPTVAQHLSLTRAYMDGIVVGRRDGSSVAPFD